MIEHRKHSSVPTPWRRSAGSTRSSGPPRIQQLQRAMRHRTGASHTSHIIRLGQRLRARSEPDAGPQEVRPMLHTIGTLMITIGLLLVLVVLLAVFGLLGLEVRWLIRIWSGRMDDD